MTWGCLNSSRIIGFIYSLSKNKILEKCCSSHPTTTYFSNPIHWIIVVFKESLPAQPILLDLTQIAPKKRATCLGVFASLIQRQDLKNLLGHCSGLCSDSFAVCLRRRGARTRKKRKGMLADSFTHNTGFQQHSLEQAKLFQRMYKLNGKQFLRTWYENRLVLNGFVVSHPKC